MVRDSFALTPFREVTVVSPDSDSFGSLIDVVAKGVAKRLINPLVSKLTLVIGKGALTKTIDVISRVNTMGLNFARAYIGLQEFTGTVWGGKFLGVTKKHWAEAFFLAADDDLLEAFSQLGEDLFTPDQVPEKLVNTLEKFVHQIHGGNRWTLF